MNVYNLEFGRCAIVVRLCAKTSIATNRISIATNRISNGIRNMHEYTLVVSWLHMRPSFCPRDRYFRLHSRYRDNQFNGNIPRVNIKWKILMIVELAPMSLGFNLLLLS